MSVHYKGKRYRQSTGLEDTAKNRRIVKTQMLPEFQAQIFSDDGLKRQEPKTIRHYADLYLLNKETELKWRTYYRYNQTIKKHILPKFANHLPHEIKVSDVRQFVQEILIKHGKSEKTAEHYINIFRGILQEAVYDEAIDSNPFKHLRALKKNKPDVFPFTSHEVDLLLRNAEGWLQSFIAIGVYTGMRTGEIIGLQWQDITNSHIQVRRTRDFNQDGTPKTKHSVRDIPIMEPLRPYLQEQRKLTELGTYVFINSLGNPWADTQHISQIYWKPLLNKLKLRYRKMYQMRHTFATAMLESGKYKVTDIAYMLGHSSTEMLFRVYSRCIESEAKKVKTNADIYNSLSA